MFQMRRWVRSFHDACTQGTHVNEDLAHAIDLEVIKTMTDVSSATTERDQEFKAVLLQRDICCVWTGADARAGEALHIIPYRRGSEVCSMIFRWEHVSSSPFLRLPFQWLQLIIANRPKCGGNVTGLHQARQNEELEQQQPGPTLTGAHEALFPLQLPQVEIRKAGVVNLNRTLTRTTTTYPVGEPIVEFSSTKQLVETIRDAIEGTSFKYCQFFCSLLVVERK